MEFFKSMLEFLGIILLADIVLILLFGARVSSYFEKKVNRVNENFFKYKQKDDVK